MTFGRPFGDVNNGCPEPSLRTLPQNLPEIVLGFHDSDRRSTFRPETDSRASFGARDFKDAEGVDEREVLAGPGVAVGGFQLEAVAREADDR